jgi:hypothetical protein
MIGVIAVIAGIVVKVLYLDLDNEEHDSSEKTNNPADTE